MPYCFYTFSSQSRRPSFTPLSKPPWDCSRRRTSSPIAQSSCPGKESDHLRHGWDVGRNNSDKMAQEREHFLVCPDTNTQSVEPDGRMAVSTAILSAGAGPSRNTPKRFSRSYSEIDSSKNLTRQCSCSHELEDTSTIQINVGGQVFETYTSTLKRLRTCKLSNDSEMKRHFREDRGDYFFDRDPQAFSVILNYLRTGELHLPTYFCGPALQSEFQFWEIDEEDIERCCWQPYNTWKTQHRSLEKLEYDRKQSTTHTDLAADRHSRNCWKRSRAVMWTFLQDPSYCFAAKVS